MHLGIETGLRISSLIDLYTRLAHGCTPSFPCHNKQRQMQTWQGQKQADLQTRSYHAGRRHWLSCAASCRSLPPSLSAGAPLASTGKRSGTPGGKCSTIQECVANVTRAYTQKTYTHDRRRHTQHIQHNLEQKKTQARNNMQCANTSLVLIPS